MIFSEIGSGGGGSIEFQCKSEDGENGKWGKVKMKCTYAGEVVEKQRKKFDQSVGLCWRSGEHGGKKNLKMTTPPRDVRFLILLLASAKSKRALNKISHLGAYFG